MYTTICNRAQIKYQTDSDGRQHTITTPPCTAQLNTLDLPLQIMVSKSYAEVGEVFFYTFVFHNATPFTLMHLVCHCLLNPVLTYVENSLIYNNVTLEKMEFEENLELPDLLPSRFGILQFKVYAAKLPDPDTIINSYSLTYDSITTNPRINIVENEPELRATELTLSPVDTLYSGLVETCLGNCSLHLEQTPAKETLTKNNQIHMDGTVTNTGNTTLTDGYVSLKFPDGTSFVPNSLYVNNSPAELTADNTFSVGTLDPDDIVSYYYDLQVNEELPEGNLDAIAIAKGINSDIRSSHSSITSNEVINHFTIDPYDPALEGVKLELSASCCTIECGDTFTYSLSIYNQNDYPITGLSLTFNLPDELCYVPYSILINSTNPQLSDYPGTLSLPDLDAKKSHQITLGVTLHSLPSTLTISNFFTLKYDYTTSLLQQHRLDQSNTLVLSTSCHMLQLCHTPDHFALVSNDTICYTGTLSNLSSDDCLTTYISFCFPAETCLISDSVMINNLPACFSPKGELYVGDLLRGESVTFCYALQLNENLPDSLMDSAVAYGSAKDSCSTHPAVLSNTVVNRFWLADSTESSNSSSNNFVDTSDKANSPDTFTHKPLPNNDFIVPPYNTNFTNTSMTTPDNTLLLLLLLVYLMHSV